LRSKAIQGVDDWLGQADEVLKCQREQGISPSSVPTWDAGEVEGLVTLADFDDVLATIIEALSQRPGRWVLVAESDPDRYWQLLAFEDGSLIAEVVSNHWLKADKKWRTEQETRLGELEWNPPESIGSPNWSKVESTTSPDHVGVAQQAIRTLKQVFGLSGDDKLLVKLFSSPNRGSTPATPTYEEGS
jgi:hypothetical protein